MVTVDIEERLGQTLLQLARTMGKKDPRSIRIELRIYLHRFTIEQCKAISHCRQGQIRQRAE
jgi:hypothetical protein